MQAVASSLDLISTRDMLEALIGGGRDPHTLAGLARGRMKNKHAELIEALTGAFDDHHGELTRIMLDQIDGLTRQIDQLTTRIDELIAAIPAATVPDHDDGDTGNPAARALPAVQRLAEIPGVGHYGAQAILAEVGLDMTRFPTPEHLVSWAKLCPAPSSPAARTPPARQAKGNPYLKGVLGNAAAGASRTDTFLGERYRRLVKRRGKLKALVAVARSVLVVIWHLLTDPTARFHDLGSDYYNSRVDKAKRTRNYIRQLQALGFTVTFTAA